MVGLGDIGSFTFSLESSNIIPVPLGCQYSRNRNEEISHSYVIMTLCSVSVATTLPVESIGTSVIVDVCYDNNNPWNPIDQPPYSVFYRLACAPKV